VSPTPVFHWPLRVYWEDTDAGGVVYHAGYLRFLERARSEWLRARGVSQRELARAPGLVFAVIEMQLAFKAPARLDDELVVSVEVLARRPASLEFSQHVVRCSDNRSLLKARVRVACLDAERFAPRAIPADLFPE
jgi:acyl-CoA thioester hydrolase